MPYEPIHAPVERFGPRVLGQRPNSAKVFNWLEKNPEKFDQLLEAFDAAILLFNENGAALPENCINARTLKAKLKIEQLPTIASINEHPSTFTTARRFFMTLKEVDKMMQRGEMPPDKRKQPWLRFHTTKNMARTLVVAAISHVYEEYVVKNHLAPGKRGEIESALIESMANLPRNKCWEAISSQKKLNWVNGDSHFSASFRKEHGLT